MERNGFKSIVLSKPCYSKSGFHIHRMTDNSKLVLRWEIDNPEEKFATGKVESGEFEEGEFRWTIVGEETRDGEADFTLQGEASRYRKWKCEVEVEIRQCTADGLFDGPWPKKRFEFNVNNSSFLYRSDWDWESMSDEGFFFNGKIVLEFLISLISFEKDEQIAEPGKFAAPNEMSNVILKIGEKKLHVSKELLSINSPVFKAMFFGEFAEKGKEEVEIKDVVAEEFIDLLHMIYPGRIPVTDSTVVHLLGLADRFQIKDILELAKEHLQYSKKITIAEKLRVADLFRLSGLRDYCLQSYSSSQKIAELKPTPEFANYSADMKAAICVRLMELVQAKK